MFFYISKNKTEHIEYQPIQKLEYCKAELTDLCILSFGRDSLSDEMTITVFAPKASLPTFYVEAVRISGNLRYNCQLDKENKRYVLCTGDAISLREKVQIELISLENDDLLAKGDFLINAILISSPLPTTKTATPKETKTSTPEPWHLNH